MLERVRAPGAVLGVEVCVFVPKRVTPFHKVAVKSPLFDLSRYVYTKYHFKLLIVPQFVS